MPSNAWTAEERAGVYEERGAEDKPLLVNPMLNVPGRWEHDRHAAGTSFALTGWANDWGDLIRSLESGLCAFLRASGHQ